MVSTLYASPNTPWSPATSISIKQQRFPSPVRWYQRKINKEPKCAKYTRNNKGLTTLWCSYKIHENQRDTCACHVPSSQGAMKLSEVWEILLNTSKRELHQFWFWWEPSMKPGILCLHSSNKARPFPVDGRQIEQKPNQDHTLQWFEWGLWKRVGSSVPAQRWRWGLMRGARRWGEYALHH